MLHDRRQPFPLPLSGQCRCGQLRYQISEAPIFGMICHCTDCQQLTSTAFSVGLVVPETGFALEGEPRCWEKQGESGGWSRQYTCPTCAGWTHTTTKSSADLVVVRPATLHDPSWFRPVAQIYTRSALPWALMPTLFSFDTEFEDAAPLEKAFAAANAAGGIRSGL